MTTVSNWTFACVTFGCKVNQYETEAIREAWTRAGGLECESAADAGLVLVNSCAITGKAERDARNALVRLHRENPAALLVLTGCAARLVADFRPRRDAPWPKAHCIIVPERKEALCEAATIADLVARAQNPGTDALPDQAADLAQEFSPNVLVPELQAGFPLAPTPWGSLGQRAWPAMAIDSFRRVRPVLKVQDGCSHRCTYCIVPLSRGPHVSRAPADVLAEARRLLQDHAELMISGINLGQYGRDNRAFGSFWDLLEFLDQGLADFAGRRRLRISSLEPAQIGERACAVLSASQLVAPHLHISLQHASQSVLKRMGRGHYKAGMLRDALERLAAFWPQVGLGADILVGFPGETPADVDILCRFLEDLPFTYAHVFPYSRRPGTPAASFADQVEHKEKLARARVVREVVAGKARAFWQQRVTAGTEQILRLCVDASEGQRLQGHVHAVDELYTPCFVPAGQLADLAAAGREAADFVPAVADRVCGHGVVVRVLPD